MIRVLYRPFDMLICGFKHSILHFLELSMSEFRKPKLFKTKYVVFFILLFSSVILKNMVYLYLFFNVRRKKLVF